MKHIDIHTKRKTENQQTDINFETHTPTDANRRTKDNREDRHETGTRLRLPLSILSRREVGDAGLDEKWQVTRLQREV